MTLKVAVLGTCVSADWIHFRSVRNPLDVTLLQFQPSSIISAMAAPVNMTIDAGDLNETETSRLRADFDKSFLSTLVDFAPDVLILEVLGDSRRGVIPAGDSFVTRNFRVENSPMGKQFASASYFTPMESPDAYYALFQDSAKRLKSFLDQKLPNCTVILNQARWSEYHVDELDQLKSYPPNMQNEYWVANLRLEALERIALDELKCAAISVDEVPIFADDRHIFGPASEHYIKSFYTIFIDKLRVIITGKGLQ